MSANTTLVPFLTPRCFVCGEATTLYVPAEGLAAWNSGTLIQNAFPNASADDREMLMTGTHPACWDSMFAEPDDDDDDYFFLEQDYDEPLEWDWDDGRFDCYYG